MIGVEYRVVRDDDGRAIRLERVGASVFQEAMRTAIRGVIQTLAHRTFADLGIQPSDCRGIASAAAVDLSYFSPPPIVAKCKPAISGLGVTFEPRRHL